MWTVVSALFAPGLQRPIHPLHAILLSFPLPMFLSALLSDIAYASTFHIQWINFSAWLLVGGLIGGGFALLWTLVELVRDRSTRSMRPLTFAGLMLLMWVLGFINSLVHAKDGWATMPDSLWLSSIATVLALVAAWIGYSGLRAGDPR
jgi:uncharacterized membrane protein